MPTTLPTQPDDRQLPSTLDPASLPARLSTARTIDRSLVHRDGICEVLLTDVARVGDVGDTHAGATFAVAAHVPRGHFYYDDHLLPVVDPVLLVEVVRQAESAIAHLFLDVPRAAKFVVRSLAATITAPLPTAATGDGSTVYAIVTVANPTEVLGSLRAAAFRAVVRHTSAAGVVTELGEVELVTAFFPPTGYAYLRGERGSRGGLAELVRPDDRHGLAEPGSVGRSSAGNVVIGEPVHTQETSTAQLLPAYGNASMFDHPQDHVPAMVLLEAARQLAVHRATTFGESTPTPGTLRIESEFHAFVELDAPVILTMEGGTTPTVTVTDEATGARLATLRLGAAA